MLTKEELRKLPKDFSYCPCPDIPLNGISLLLAFKAFKSEPDITPVLEKAKKLGIKTVYPSLDPYVFDGIELKQINENALMLVPGLFFTKDGKRLGRGKGFYDRSLSVLPPCVHTVGICKKSRILNDLPTDEHDMKVDEVLIC